MFVVAVSRWGQRGPAYRSPEPAQLEREALEIAALLGLGAYEAKLVVASPLPAVLLETPDVERARGLLAALRARGHGVVACDAATLADGMLAPRELRFTDDAVIGVVPGSPEVRVAHGDVLALLVALQVREAESTRESKKKELSLARIALTGGLMRTKTTTVSEREVSQERERVLYVMSKRGSGHLLLRETQLRYASLGERLGKSSAENFTTLLAVLRERAPHAHFDDRLLRYRRGGGNLRVSGTTAQRTVTVSNDTDLDLAAQLLCIAVLQGQI